MASFESKVIGRCVPDFKNECFKINAVPMLKLKLALRACEYRIWT
jgi:hypothetical protein